MTSAWTIYAIVVGDRYDYIGIARNTYARWHSHKCGAYFGVECRMATLNTARTQAAARKKEARLIRKHRPPRNVQHNGRCTFEVVRTQRWNGSIWLDCECRVYVGMMHPDDARTIWHGSAGVFHSGEVLKRMPGWTLPRASYMFGYRQRHAPVSN